MAARSVVTVFLESEGKILLLHRGSRVGTYTGRWAGVSGSIDPGNTPEQQARVEIREETGLRDDDIQFLSAGRPVAFADAEHGWEWIVHPFRVAVLHPDRIRIDWE